MVTSAAASLHLSFAPCSWRGAAFPKESSPEFITPRPGISLANARGGYLPSKAEGKAVENSLPPTSSSFFVEKVSTAKEH